MVAERVFSSRLTPARHLPTLPTLPRLPPRVVLAGLLFAAAVARADDPPRRAEGRTFALAGDVSMSFFDVRVDQGVRGEWLLTPDLSVGAWVGIGTGGPLAEFVGRLYLREVTFTPYFTARGGVRTDEPSLGPVSAVAEGPRGTFAVGMGLDWTYGNGLTWGFESVFGGEMHPEFRRIALRVGASFGWRF